MDDVNSTSNGIAAFIAIMSRAALEQLRGVAIELRVAALGEAVHVFNAGDKVTDGRFAGDSRNESQLIQLFDSLAWWGRALSNARAADHRSP